MNNNENDFNSNDMNNNQGDAFYNNFSNNQNGNMQNNQYNNPNNQFNNTNNQYNNPNNQFNNGYANNYGIQEKEYNSGFLDSHTEVTEKSKLSRFLLFGFYGLFLIIIIVLLILLLRGKGNDAISFKKSSLVLEIGDTEVLEVIDSKGKIVEDELTWTTNDSDVVTVDDNGVVSAVSEGKAVVTVENAKGNKDNCNITVTDSSATPTDEPTPTNEPTTNPTTKPTNNPTNTPKATAKATATPKPTSSTQSKNRCCCLSKDLTRCSWRSNVTKCPSEQPYEDSGQTKCGGSAATATPKPTTGEPSIPASSFNTKYQQVSTAKIELAKGESKTFTIKVYNAVAIFDLKVTKAKDDATHISLDKTATDFIDGLSGNGDPQWATATITVTGKTSGYNYIVVSPSAAGVVTYDTSQYLKGTHTILVHVK